jgi:toxin ParE1/3/4
MGSYHVAQEAENDLVDIVRYTEERWGLEQSKQYVYELFALFDEIAAHPEPSTRMDIIKDGLRKRLHPKRQHAVYFRIVGEDVENLRVLHSRRDQTNEFGTPPGR